MKRGASMSCDYKRISLSFVFLFINFSINGLNLTPCFIGYILLLIATTNLHNDTHFKYFKRCETLSTILLLLSFYFSLAYYVENISRILTLFVVVLHDILLISFLYNLYKGTVKFLKSKHTNLLATFEQYLPLHIFCFVILIPISSLHLVIDLSEYIILNIIIFVSGIIISLFLASEANTIAKNLKEYESENY